MPLTMATNRDTPQLVSYIYDFAGGEAQLAVCGALHAKGPVHQNSNSSARSSSRKVIGAHGGNRNFFNGDIAEVLIYNAALSAEEKEAVEGYLMEKYGISLWRHPECRGRHPKGV